MAVTTVVISPLITALYTNSVRACADYFDTQSDICSRLIRTIGLIFGITVSPRFQ